MPESTELKRSVQSRPSGDASGVPASDFLSTWLQIMADSDEAPPYWSRKRDEWLRDFVTTPGNDLLVGTISTVLAKVATTGWYLEGPERTANLYRQILLERSDFGGGWSQLCQKAIADYLTQDAGGWIERIRMSKRARVGAAIGFVHLDNAQMQIRSDPEYPAQYTNSFDGAEPVTMHQSQVIHLVDNPSPKEKMLNVGFCALSRALTTGRILMDITRYERERLSDLPPAGLLMLNNLSMKQWEDLVTQYDTRQQQRGNQVWRQVMIAFGLDPSVPMSAEMFSFSTLPEHFSRREITEIAINSFALAFRIDPREIWPISTGPLGTATETAVQHMKARAKGAGLLLTEMERHFNDGLSLPASLAFKFDYQDSDEDRQAAEIAQMKAEYIRTLSEPFAARGGVVEEAAIITREEARAWLVREGLFDEEDLLTMDDEGRATDTEEAKSLALDMGPRVRAYSNGRTLRLEKRGRVWPVQKADPIKPRGANEPLPPVPGNVEITESDIQEALDQWDRLMPEYAGMLSADVQGRTDYGDIRY